MQNPPPQPLPTPILPLKLPNHLPLLPSKNPPHPYLPQALFSFSPPPPFHPPSTPILFPPLHTPLLKSTSIPPGVDEIWGEEYKREEEEGGGRFVCVGRGGIRFLGLGVAGSINGLLAEYAKPLDKEFHSPRDAHGHGTHTLSTAAGSFVANISCKGLGLGTIRGGAPNVRLAIYKVCWNVLGGKCSTADMLKAFDEAIHDGVDVLSLSLVNYVPLFSDVDERDGIATGSFHAVAKGITVMCATGNNGSSAHYPCNEDFPCIEVDYGIGTRILFISGLPRYPLVKLSPPKMIVGKPLSAKVAYFSYRGPNSITPTSLKPNIAAPSVNILAATSPLYSFTEGGYAMMSGTSMSTSHVTGIVALIKRMHPNWSSAAIKSAIVTTAWRNGPSGLPIFAEGSPQKLANSFDFGGGLVNPNGAAEPGLVYDMGAADYMEYLCAREHNNSAISRLIGKITTCPVKKPFILDVNLPSVTIPSPRNPITVKRTVTNVGAPESIYKATIEPPFGTIVYVNPTALAFNSTVEKLTFTITISAIHEMNTGYYFGSLTWVDGVHAVRISLSVKTEFLQPHDDDED
ncbi:subtilisin-like protease SBT3.3 [Malus sylvestris]|uniref:subtilisin-like protease SBT3.3 n=1 Tax=Malus sylvestris TaxID=3752 RepID=UPI0021AD3F9F|nr:subtilisin-like protease SBT3.3 [Malus sylvestris]